MNLRDKAKFRNKRQEKPRQPGPITRAVNDWFNRLMGIAKDRSFDQEEQYAANKTTRDFICNGIGSGVWGVVFPLLTIVATQISGAELAGEFSMAFVLASILMILANFGMRTYQISDIDEEYSFADYQITRIITCVAMLLVGYFYVCVRGYDQNMATMCMGLFVYRMVDGLADVYEGRLQQVGKLYLAGISVAVRSVVALIIFCILLLITGSLVVASVGMGVTAFIVFLLLTLPLAYLETPKSRRASVNNIIALFQQAWPLFVALFLYALIDNMPKFVMEGALSYDNQLYFNALYFPAQMILVIAQLVYKPLLVRMAEAWNNPEQRRKFTLIIVAMIGAIVGITVVMFVIMATIGIPVMSFLYGLDFEPYRKLCYIMICAGGITAGIDFLYQTVTVLRRQRDVIVVYLITVVFAIFVPFMLVNLSGLTGAVTSYMITMAILFVLLLWVYVRIRTGIVREEREGVRRAQVEKRERWQRGEPQVPADPRASRGPVRESETPVEAVRRREPRQGRERAPEELTTRRMPGEAPAAADARARHVAGGQRVAREGRQVRRVVRKAPGSAGDAPRGRHGR